MELSQELEYLPGTMKGTLLTEGSENLEIVRRKALPISAHTR
jgi:hypothetical protein